MSSAAGDDLVGVEQEVGEERLLLPAANGTGRPSSTTSSGPRMRNSMPTPLFDRSTVFCGCLARGITGELPLQWPDRGHWNALRVTGLPSSWQMRSGAGPPGETRRT